MRILVTTAQEMRERRNETCEEIDGIYFSESLIRATAEKEFEIDPVEGVSANQNAYIVKRTDNPSIAPYSRITIPVSCARIINDGYGDKPYSFDDFIVA